MGVPLFAWCNCEAIELALGIGELNAITGGKVTRCSRAWNCAIGSIGHGAILGEENHFCNGIVSDVTHIRLSPSRMSEFNNCPRLYKYRVIEQLPEPPSIDAERGTLIHTILEDLFDLHPAERNHASAIEMAPERWRIQLSEKPGLAELVPNEKEWFDRVSALLTNYFVLEKPETFEATHREMHLEQDLNPQVYLHGYVDRIDVAPTGQVRIVDYKSGKSPKAGWEEKALFQLRVYAFLYWRLHGVIPALLVLHYLGDARSVKSSPTESELLSTEKKLLQIADEIIAAVEKDHFPPKPSRLCDWCFFKSVCPAHN
jgi:putative RecB family exonuclease